jgi:hypothetical protein
MFFQTLAAIITLVGVIGFVISSLLHASGAGDFLFNAAAICITIGPLIFFCYVIIGLCLEFASITRKTEVKIAVHVPSVSVPVGMPSHLNWMPEGLRRERNGPLSPSTGRANKI